MAISIADGTDGWTGVPASLPLRLTIRACLMIIAANAPYRCIDTSQKAGRCWFSVPAISGWGTEPHFDLTQITQAVLGRFGSACPRTPSL